MFMMAPYGYGQYHMNRRRKHFEQYDENENDEDLEEYDYDSNEIVSNSDVKCKIVSRNGTRYSCDHDVHKKNIYTHRNHEAKKQIELEEMRFAEDRNDAFEKRNMGRSRKTHLGRKESNSDATVLIYKKDD